MTRQIRYLQMNDDNHKNDGNEFESKHQKSISNVIDKYNTKLASNLRNLALGNKRCI